MSETKESKIEFQKELAKKILKDLKVIDPRAYLAGGAPRDWEFGEEANDLDFYYFTQASTMGESSLQLERFFPKVHMSGETNGDVKLYEHMEGLRRVWNTEIEGMKVQFIQMRTIEDRAKAWEHMSVSICKIKMDAFGIHKHRDFKVSQASDTMFLTKGYTWSDPHPSKIFERFKGKFRTAYDFENATDILLTKLTK